MEAPRAHDEKPRRLRRVRAREEAHLAVEKGGLKPGAGHELWFQDETEPSLLPYLVGCWGPRGVQTRVPTPGKNAKRAIFGAIRAGGGKFVGLTCPRKNGAAFCKLLFRLASRARRSGKLIVLVTDNARFHKTKAALRTIEEVSPWLEVMWLPKYASTLNEIEPYWKLVKRQFFANALLSSVEEFERRVDQVVERLNRGRHPSASPATASALAA